MEEKYENKKKNGLVIVIVILIIFVLALSGYILYDKLIVNKITESNTEVNEGNNSKNNENIDSTDKIAYKSYNLGDEVYLLDSSKWNVLEASLDSDEFIKLLSSENRNNSNITFTNAPNYISTTYKSELVTKLNASNDDIKEARLLTLDDISKISGISVSNLMPGTSLENNITPAFLYQSDTITSSIDQNCPIMICSAIPEYYETSPGRICIGTQTEVFSIRPVITISKKYLKNN